MVPVLKTLRANGKIGIYKHHVALPGHHQLVLRDLVGRKTLPLHPQNTGIGLP